MKKVLKHIGKYVSVYIIVVLILFLMLVITSKIPKEAIYENLKESAEYYRELPGIRRRSLSKEYETLHYAADSKLLNMMYYIDSEHPIKSSMEARFYEECEYDSNSDFVKVMDENIESNQQYLRYWHGSLSILRPLMTIFNIEQIYMLGNIVFWILMVTLIIILLKRYKTLAIVFMIASFMVRIDIVPQCIEYIWTVLIMLIVSIISLLIEKKGNKGLYLLYFITGIVTCYFDFLSTETLTILIPVMLTVLVRYKEGRLQGFKEGFKFIAISSILWFLSYALMWATKWMLASIILNLNAIEYVKENALLRLNMSSDIEIPKYNFKTVAMINIMKIYPLNKIITNPKVFLFTVALFIIICLLLKMISKLIMVITNKEKKTKNELWIKILLIIIGIIPYLRYLVMMNHSYCHSFFTYRAQMPTLIALMFIIIYSIDSRLRKITIKRLRNIDKKEQE